jgi:hypothetical protein
MTADAAQTLSQDLAGLVRAELHRLQGELTGTARRAGTGAALLGGAGVMGALAAGTSAAALLRLMDKVMPRPLSAALLSVMYGGAAAGMAVAGVAQLRRAVPAAVEETVVDLRDDVVAARESAEQQGG